MPEDGAVLRATGRAPVLGLYDPVMARTMRERAWRPRVVELTLAGVARADVVEVGAGTGTLAIELVPAGARVVAVEPDPEALARARGKPGADAVRWVAATAAALPLADASADRVVMSLLLHHLDPAGQDAALAEARRVLRPGGRLVVADWGRPRGALPRLGFLALRLLDGYERTRDHAAGRLPDRIAGAGFAPVTRHASWSTAWGTLDLLSGGLTPPARATWR